MDALISYTRMCKENLIHSNTLGGKSVSIFSCLAVAVIVYFEGDLLFLFVVV
jgi:hypothetical protein